VASMVLLSEGHERRGPMHCGCPLVCFDSNSPHWAPVQSLFPGMWLCVVCGACHSFAGMHLCMQGHALHAGQ